MAGALPDPGSAWIGPEGVTWWIVAITPRGVLVHSERGDQRTIARWDWPEGLRPAQPTQACARIPLRAMLVGGTARPPHFERLRSLAQDADIDVVFHVPWNKDAGSRKGRFLRVDPAAEVEIVLLLSDVMSHAQYGWYKRSAKDHNVPFLTLPSRGFAHELEKGLRRLATDPRLEDRLAEWFGSGASVSCFSDGWWELTEAGWERREATSSGDRHGLLAALLSWLVFL